MMYANRRWTERSWSCMLERVQSVPSASLNLLKSERNASHGLRSQSAISAATPISPARPAELPATAARLSASRLWTAACGAEEPGRAAAWPQFHRHRRQHRCGHQLLLDHWLDLLPDREAEQVCTLPRASGYVSGHFGLDSYHRFLVYPLRRL